MKVTGNAGADDAAKLHTVKKRFEHHEFYITFYARQIYASNVPTICEVYFYVDSAEVSVLKVLSATVNKKLFNMFLSCGTRYQQNLLFLKTLQVMTQLTTKLLFLEDLSAFF